MKFKIFFAVISIFYMACSLNTQAMMEDEKDTKCRYFNGKPGSCRYGEKCKFSHVKETPEEYRARKEAEYKSYEEKLEQLKVYRKIENDIKIRKKLEKQRKYEVKAYDMEIKNKKREEEENLKEIKRKQEKEFNERMQRSGFSGYGSTTVNSSKTKSSQGIVEIHGNYIDRYGVPHTYTGPTFDHKGKVTGHSYTSTGFGSFTPSGWD